MIDFSLITIIPANETYREFSYQVKKAAEGKYITEMFGWNENAERDFHTGDWQRHKPDIILYDGKSIGTIATIENVGLIEIAQFFILPEYQNKGIGAHLLKSILDKADQLSKNAKLKILKNNPAKSLYVRYDFKIVHTDESFYYMERKQGGIKEYW